MTSACKGLVAFVSHRMTVQCLTCLLSALFLLGVISMVSNFSFIGRSCPKTYIHFFKWKRNIVEILKQLLNLSKFSIVDTSGEVKILQVDLS